MAERRSAMLMNPLALAAIGQGLTAPGSGRTGFDVDDYGPPPPPRPQSTRALHQPIHTPAKKMSRAKRKAQRKARKKNG